MSILGRGVELHALESCCTPAREPLTPEPNISHHLKVLRTAGLVDAERVTWVYYWPVPDVLDQVRAVLDELSPAAPA